MSLKEIQKNVDDWVGQYKEGYWPEHIQLARLMEEVGELAREVNHKYGPKKKKEAEQTGEIANEMADIIFTIAAMANAAGLDLDQAWQKMMSKYYKRDEARWEKK